MRREGNVVGASRDSRLRGNDIGGCGLLVDEIAAVTSFPRNDGWVEVSNGTDGRLPNARRRRCDFLKAV